MNIYRKISMKVVDLLKEDSSLLVGAFGIYEFLEGVETESMEFHFYFFLHIKG
jgi:hypothetical protein